MGQTRCGNVSTERGKFTCVEFLSCDFWSLSFGLMPQSWQLSSFPDMKKKRMQMSTQDAFSLNTVPSFVLRTQIRDILIIIKTYIYQIQQSPPRRSANRKSETKHFQL